MTGHTKEPWTALIAAGTALAELFQHALETEGYGKSHDDLIEIDAHFRDWMYALATIPDPEAYMKAARGMEAEIARLNEELRKAKQAHWFYLGDSCDSDDCRFGIDEVISEDFEWDNKPEGDHVLMVSGGRPVPDMWVALHYYTESEKEARGSDDEYDYTVHATKEEAEAALSAFRAATGEQA